MHVVKRGPTYLNQAHFRWTVLSPLFSRIFLRLLNAGKRIARELGARANGRCVEKYRRWIFGKVMEDTSKKGNVLYF